MNVDFRNEIKYELTRAAGEYLQEIVGGHLPCFEYQKGHPYTYVTTIYFDTDRLDFFKDALVSYDDNVKIRLKEYGYKLNSHSRDDPDDDAICFLEIKKRVSGLVDKRRIRIPKILVDRLIAGEEIWNELVSIDPQTETEESRDIYQQLRLVLKSFKIRPRSSIRYRRRAYQKTERELRITFDDQLTVFAPTGKVYNGFYENLHLLTARELWEPIRTIDKVIMEIKHQDGYPPWLTAVLKDYLPRRTSKFTTSISFVRLRTSGEDAGG